MPLSPQVADLPRRVFSPIARDYDRPALVLSLLQYRRWHRFLLSRLTLPQNNASVGTRVRILDMATGTGALALDLAQRPGVEVVGADITRPMLLRARSRTNGAQPLLGLVEATADAPPFADESFDAVVFGYLLRYVDDVPATLHALARLLRPGGVMASLDFAVARGPAYPLWRLYTDAILPLGGRVFSRDWRDVGRFLGPNIRDFYGRWPEPRLLDAWRDAGLEDVRSKRLSLGGGIVIWGRKA